MRTGRRLVAQRRFRPGDTVLEIDGVLVGTPSRYSLQIGPGRHLLPPPEATADVLPVRYPWVFVNHSCRPCAEVHGRRLVATRAITVGEEVTIDYNTTETALAEPFICQCGNCDGQVIHGHGVPGSAVAND